MVERIYGAIFMDKHQWSDADKAQWILENGMPEIKYIYERNGSLVYKRPIRDEALPPWISLEREFVFKTNNFSFDIAEYGFLGIIFLTILTYIIHFFLPLNQTVNFIIFGIIIVSLVVFYGVTH